jgi:hypothetical protein
LNPQAQASPFYIEDGKTFGHKGPDGTISFFVQDADSKWKLQIHKVFSTDGKFYYFLYADVINHNFETNPLPSLVMTVDNQNIPLKLLEGTKPVIVKKNLIAYYDVPEEVIQMLAKADTMVLTFQFDNTKVAARKTILSQLAGFKQLGVLEKSSYIREGQVLDSTQDIEKAIFHPQLFIPNVTPEEVIDALIYETNFNTYKGKEEFDYSNGYFVYHTSDPQVVQLLCRQGLSSGCDFVTIACRPYENGVWVTLSLRADAPEGYTFYEQTRSRSFVGTMGYWRTNSRLWGMKLQSVYGKLYGKTDYGFICDPKNSKKGPFKIISVDTKMFPQLDGVKAGDMLTNIDNVSTAFMSILDLEYWLDNGTGGTRTFTFKTVSGEEKKITITPQFHFSKPEERKDYKKVLAEKMPKWFVEKEIKTLVPGNGYSLESNIYNPLGISLK